MTTLELLTHNWRETGRRDPYPADAETIAQLRNMEPAHASPTRGALMRDCVTWENGSPLYFHAYRTGPILFVRLSTRTEYATP